MRKIQLGGQAVIEGVMIRSPSGYAVSVKKPDGEIVVKYFAKETKMKTFPFKLPLIRGVVAAYELFTIALSAIDFSTETLGEKKSPFSFPIAIIAGLILFIAVPYYLTVLTGIAKGSFSFHLIDGIFKIIIIIAYLLAIRIFKDVQRIFALHGAEHAVVNSYEQGEVTRSTFHARCGTNFIVIIVIVSVILFSILKVGLLWRFILLPLIFSLSYELFLILVKQNLMPSILQHLTTMTPSDNEIEVAKVALQSVLSNEVEQE